MGAGTGSVQLVGHHHVGEDRSGDKLERLVAHVEDRRSRNVAGQWVRGGVMKADNAEDLGSHQFSAYLCVVGYIRYDTWVRMAYHSFNNYAYG